jgi:two-component system sensor histidine kinase ResE
VAFWRSVVGKLWATIIILVAIVLLSLGVFLIQYVDHTFNNARDVKRLLVVTGIIGFLLTTFFAFFLSSRITSPLVHMKKAADLITQGDYSARVPAATNDEIGQLAHTMNHMAEELERTIQALSLERDRLSSVLGSMVDAVITFDAEGTVILSNPQGKVLLDEWGQIHWSEEQDATGDRLPEPLMSVYHQVIEGKNEVATRLHVGSEDWSVVMAPLYAGQALQGAVAVLRDVTEEFRLEKLRTDFVANVSHELRTPLAMMQGYSEALLDDIASSAEERKELAQIINDESLRMGRLVQDLLDLAKMQAGKLELIRGIVDMNALLTRVTRKFMVLGNERHVEIRLHAKQSDLRLDHADEDRIEQVLTNLLDNAIRHSPPETSITITAVSCALRGEPAVQLTIADQGQGIHEADLPFIFERFFKGDKARTRGVNSGTGLGLSIVKNIIDAHRGTIEVSSTIGSGTTFSIKLPQSSS